MHWLEPLVEIDGGRASARPRSSDVDAILDGSSRHSASARSPSTRSSPGQQRLTFARAGKTRPPSLEDYEATGGWAGLRRARQIGGAQIVEEVTASGLRGRGGAGFPAGIKWKTVAKTPGRAEVHRLQRRRGRQRHVRRPHGDGRRSLSR